MFEVFDWVSVIFFNVSTGLFMRLRATFWNLIRSNHELHESAFRYGLIPMHVPNSKKEKYLAFHFVIDNIGNTTNESSSVVIGP